MDVKSFFGCCIYLNIYTSNYVCVCVYIYKCVVCVYITLPPARHSEKLLALDTLVLVFEEAVMHEARKVSGLVSQLCKRTIEGTFKDFLCT